MINKWIMILIILLVSIVPGCSNEADKGELESVGLLVTDTISDQVWGTKGYKGMLKIEAEYGVDVYYKERIDSQILTERAIEEFSHKGVNLVFGHGMEYAEFFNKIAPEYPDMHFVSFNGQAAEKNTTSLKFDSHAMGFFGGMTAAHASKTETIGIIASYKWQPEIKGFVEGAKFENKDIQILIEYVNDWDDEDKALLILDGMMKKNVDVVYPAGDGYNVPVIERLKENQLYAIGYVSDQSELGEDTVLTSTIQHVDKLYLLIAQRFAENELKSGNLSFDFSDGVISMSEFNSHIDKEFADQLVEYVDRYIDTGKLPNK
ncbi:transcriptional activator of comK gene [Bacillus ectoiniformans]|uniref:BMP family ABC transporter substrate-binding protein n=1 Tax=Bacillus ectoiniformans TaxID=1494429 RepID=UPI00195D2008|nr:BMP family ABC transporter substrate-binding protein [Bacillus ectoiniformans]MBM7647555.1 transcriptional activator of comK gene [Bacillus ectoiniformans]